MYLTVSRAEVATSTCILLPSRWACALTCPVIGHTCVHVCLITQSLGLPSLGMCSAVLVTGDVLRYAQFLGLHSLSLYSLMPSSDIVPLAVPELYNVHVYTCILITDKCVRTVVMET